MSRSANRRSFTCMGMLVAIALTGCAEPNAPRAGVRPTATGPSDSHIVTVVGGIERTYVFPGSIGEVMDVSEGGRLAGTGYPGHHARYWPHYMAENVDIPTLGGQYGSGTGVNDAGLVVGYSWIEGGGDRAFVWSEATGIQRLPTPNGPGERSVAYAINSHGQAVGWASRALLWTIDLSQNPVAQVQDLGVLWGIQGTGRSEAYDINDAGTVVGWKDVATFTPRPVTWSPASGAVVLPTLSGGGLGYAMAVNALGDVAGYSTSTAPGGIFHATLWRGGLADDLGMRANACRGESFAYGINDLGWVAGECEGRAVVWTPLAMIALPVNAGRSTARDINNAGQVVGMDAGTPTHWQLVVNRAPVANAGNAYVQVVGFAVSFDGSASTDADGDVLTYDWDFGDGTTGAGATPEHMYAGEGTFAVSLTVTDPAGARSVATTSATIINRAPVANAGGAYLAAEAEVISFDGSASGDPDGQPVAYAWDFGDGETGMGASPTHAYRDDGSYTVTLTVTDPFGAIGTATTTANVLNVAPTVGVIVAPIDPVAVHTTVVASTSFFDPGTLDVHTMLIAWGDGSTTSTDIPSGTSMPATVSGSHAYTAAGVYTVTLTVTDGTGETGQSIYQYVVVYDPGAGFVTGGGWIESPAGAYAAAPALVGKAAFGFVSKYRKGTSTPDGQTQFQFHAAAMSFHSTVYEWLVIAGPKAQFKGSGTINGAGDYGFLLTVTDGQVIVGGGADRFRLKIWEKASGTVVYDNQLNATDTSDPTTALGGGSIVIHRQ
jgi:probable HAF family extracellular repeat protein